MAISGSETQSTTLKPPTTTTTPIEVESVKYNSCGFSEDCTPAYIRRLRDRYHGRWLYGLYAEALKVETLYGWRISSEKALNRHMIFCREFRSSSPPNGAESPISTTARVLRRSLDSPQVLRSNSIGALCSIEEVGSSSLVRLESCFLLCLAEYLLLKV